MVSRRRHAARSPNGRRAVIGPGRAGKLKLVPEPSGLRGYDDVCRHVSGEQLGGGLQPSPGDLIRMLGALEREHEIATLLSVRDRG
jgi:hypothetical protein